ncbi:hypothetical protein L9F63_026964, partial [Diploptera punctata]
QLIPLTFSRHCCRYGYSVGGAALCMQYLILNCVRYPNEQCEHIVANTGSSSGRQYDGCE